MNSICSESRTKLKICLDLKKRKSESLTAIAVQGKRADYIQEREQISTQGYSEPSEEDWIALRVFGFSQPIVPGMVAL
jgi:hypothetical protein